MKTKEFKYLQAASEIVLKLTFRKNVNKQIFFVFVFFIIIIFGQLKEKSLNEFIKLG